MVAKSSANISGSSAIAAARDQRRDRVRDPGLDRKHDMRKFEAGRLQPFRPRRIADDQLRLGQGQAVPELVHLPPAIDQDGDPAGLEHRHVGDDPGRRVAHRDRHPVALGDSEIGDKRPGRAVGGRVELAEGQPLAVRDHRDRRGMERAKGVEHGRQSRRQVGDDRTPLLVAADLDSAAGPDHLGQLRIDI